MATLTLRDIDESVMNRMRSMAKKERRSLNSQVLVVLDKGLANAANPFNGMPEALIAKAQDAAWAELAGRWEGDFPPIERSFGREVDL